MPLLISGYFPFPLLLVAEMPDSIKPHLPRASVMDVIRFIVGLNELDQLAGIGLRRTF